MTLMDIMFHLNFLLTEERKWKDTEVGNAYTQQPLLPTPNFPLNYQPGQLS